MIDIAILDYSTASLYVEQADEAEIDEKFGGDVERYIVEVLGFKASNISWMVGNLKISISHDGR